MKSCLRMTAFGLAVLSLVGQEANAQFTMPPASTNERPSVKVASQKTSNPEVMRTAYQSSEGATPSTIPLSELAWMVGDWVDQDDDATIESSVDWTKNGKFLRRMFRVIPRDGATHEGMQLIAWDPAEK